MDAQASPLDSNGEKRTRRLNKVGEATRTDDTGMDFEKSGPDQKCEYVTAPPRGGERILSCPGVIDDFK
jgi:hypothetical protein